MVRTQRPHKQAAAGQRWREWKRTVRRREQHARPGAGAGLLVRRFRPRSELEAPAPSAPPATATKQHLAGRDYEDKAIGGARR